MDIFKEGLLKRRFDQILGFLNEIVRHELFVNIKYEQYIKTKAKKISLISLNYQDDFDNIFKFAGKVNSYKITNELLRKLEFEYYAIQNDSIDFEKSNSIKKASL